MNKIDSFKDKCWDSLKLNAWQMEPASSNCYMLHLKTLPCWLQLLAIAVAAWHRKAYRLLPSSQSSKQISWEKGEKEEKNVTNEKTLTTIFCPLRILQFIEFINVHVDIKEDVDCRKLAFWFKRPSTFALIDDRSTC